MRKMLRALVPAPAVSTLSVQAADDKKNDKGEKDKVESFLPSTAITKCDGSQEEVAPCNVAECYHETPVDGVFGEWSDWSDCNCSGLRERHRSIAVRSSANGKPVEGAV